MKNFTQCLIGLLLAVSPVVAANAENVDLTFNRTGATASSVTVDAAGLSGVTASLDAVSHDMKTSSANLTSDVLCPNINGNTSPTITMEFTINGLPADAVLSSIGLDIHAFNNAGEYQDHSDGKKRFYDVQVEIDGKVFGSLDEIDIAANVNPSGGRHKEWMITPAEGTGVTSPLSLKLTITRGSANEGCFFGLSQITLGVDASASIGNVFFGDDYAGELQIHDLNGRKLNEPVRGAVNIINGKKVLVK